MSLTSYRAAPPRAAVGVWAPGPSPDLIRGPGALFDQRLTAFAGSHNGYDPRNARPGGRLSGGTGLLHPAAWGFGGWRELRWGRAGRAWRRPTLPRLGAQYHRRWGFSRPSSGWDRVLCPPLWPPGRGGPPWEGERCLARRPGLAAARGRCWGCAFERLVPVGCADCSASTSGLSTWWSSTALDETWF